MMATLVTQSIFFMIAISLIHTATAGPIVCSNKASDIVFALDSSFSIGQSGFERQLAFLRAVVDQLAVEPNGFRVGVISFGSEVKVEIKLDQFDNKWELKKATKNIKHMESGSDIWKAIKYARTTMFTDEASGARPDAKKQLVLITDGLSSDPSLTLTEASIARAVGIELFSVAVGMGPQDDFETEAMASKPKSRHVFKVGDFKALAAIAGSVSGAACGGFYGDQPSHNGDSKDQKSVTAKKLTLPACKKGIAEVLFLLDSSSSIWEPDFRNQIKLIQKVTSRLDIGPNSTRVGVVAFSNAPVTLVSLAEKQTLEHVNEQLARAPYITGSTDTALVLKHARRKGFAHARPYVPRIIVLLTDGQSQDPQETLVEAKKARRFGISVIALGVNDRTKIEDLRAISADPGSDQFVFYVEDSQKLSQIPSHLAERTCIAAAKLAEAPPPASCPPSPSDIVFLYDTAALSRLHNNMVVRTIASLTGSRRLNNQGALRVGVIRNANANNDDGDANGASPFSTLVSDIELTEQWTKKSDFRHRLDPNPKSTMADRLLRKARHDYFPHDVWLSPENQGRRRLAVLFLDSPLKDKNAATLEASRLKNSGVEIAVVALGRDFSRREALSLASGSKDSHFIRPRGRGKARHRKTVRDIVKLLC